MPPPGPAIPLTATLSPARLRAIAPAASQARPRTVSAGTRSASVLLEPDIRYDYLIQVMDIVRSVEVPTGVEDEVELFALFTDISVGDAP